MASKKESMSVNLSKLILAVTVIVCIGALIGAVGYLVNRPAVIPPINSEKIYTVDEILKVRDTNPESLKGKSVLLNAYVLDATLGVNCEDYYILTTDYEDVNFYQDYIKRYSEGKITEEEKIKFDSIPRLEAAVRTVIHGGIPKHAILIGHFYDGWQVKNCNNDWTRFTITGIKETLALFAKDVVITTDKTEYEQGETVKITLENDLDKEINHNYGGCGGYSFNVQKFIDGKWEYLNTFWGACEIIKNYKVEPGKSEVYNWDQKAYDDSLAKNSLKQVSSGTYRISITYIADKKVETVYSNEFTIKEEKSEDVSIATDKTIYDKGETINIVVNNGSDKSILYSGWGGRFWDIQYFKDDEWINPAYEEGGFQLTEENIGDACDILLYERAYPGELTSQSNLTTEWNQKICPFTENPYIYKSIARYIESGKYRLVFHYGFEISGNDEFRISESKTIYSNEFAVK